MKPKSDPEFEAMVKAYADANLDMIEKDIGKLKAIEHRHLTVTFHGEKDARVFHKETLRKDLNWLNKKGMN